MPDPSAASRPELLHRDHVLHAGTRRDAVAILTLSVWMTLLRIILALREVSFNLGTIVALINSIGRQTDTVTPTIAVP